MGPCKPIDCPNWNCDSTSAYEVRSAYTSCPHPVKCTEHGVVQGICGQDIHLKDVIQCSKCNRVFHSYDLREIKCTNTHERSNDCVMRDCNYGQ
ncbi:hypothetical protein PGT21_029195 [Puccinia graminis f. sp. tritici]|uniref:Uncharacterized protein n=1 Tax=Puccinia graminis f. sp. tritici TaxID=56615 RepID=A0A5B0Q7P3_PUCGR|nr:hypothetical protein PGT21_029195 [Puccinia graminis f. sp. tritici]KAA1109171.1 hypothetical protein PGTUg99_010461 [Puccinia graminis f. sp. tritici]